MADHRHLGFSGSNNGFFDNPLYEFLYVVNRDHSSKLLILFLKKIAFFCILAPRSKMADVHHLVF